MLGAKGVHKAPLILYNCVTSRVHYNYTLGYINYSYLLAQVLISRKTNNMQGHLENARTVCPCIVILLLKALALYYLNLSLA